jgi:hypothetical protein
MDIVGCEFIGKSGIDESARNHHEEAWKKQGAIEATP